MFMFRLQYSEPPFYALILKVSRLIGFRAYTLASLKHHDTMAPCQPRTLAYLHSILEPFSRIFQHPACEAAPEGQNLLSLLLQPIYRVVHRQPWSRQQQHTLYPSFQAQANPSKQSQTCRQPTLNPISQRNRAIAKNLLLQRSPIPPKHPHTPNIIQQNQT